MQDSYQQQTTQIYDLHSKAYRSGSKDFIFPWGMFQYFVSLLKKEDMILDIWCAFGRDMERLKEAWFKPHGLEISQWLINLADEKIKKNIIKGDMTVLKDICSPESYDGIMSVASIVHMDHAIGINVLEQVYTSLKKGGVFYLSLKVADEKKIEYKESLSTPGTQKKYVYYGEIEIEEILKNIWFQIIKTHIWRPTSDIWKIVIAKK